LNVTIELRAVLRKLIKLDTLVNCSFLSDFNLYDINEQLTKVSNFISLRSTARNSIVTFNALQKVFRSRFEDGRAHVTLNQFSNLNVKQPFLTTARVSYETLLGKTKNNYFDTTFYNLNTIDIINKISTIHYAINYHFFDFPFLLSVKSDMARYM
jgi:hypothetical protein